MLLHFNCDGDVWSIDTISISLSEMIYIHYNYYPEFQTIIIEQNNRTYSFELDYLFVNEVVLKTGSGRYNIIKESNCAVWIEGEIGDLTVRNSDLLMNVHNLELCEDITICY